MDAKELTFGIEVETVAPASALRDEGLDIGHYHAGHQVPYLMRGWKAERDGSIHSGGGYACEIVSPVLKGEAGLQQVAEAVKTLAQKGHRVNSTCGVHVHVGWKRDWPADALARLIGIVAYCERGLYAITGTKKRERGRFCNGVRKYGNGRDAKRMLDRERYHALNLSALANGYRETVEFRVFSGSLSPAKVVGWIQVCLGLCERALNSNRTPKWEPTPPTGGWKKAGPGRSETERLLGYLAWGNGYAKLHDGKQFGWVSSVVAQDEVKATFRRLAAKYDAEN